MTTTEAMVVDLENQKEPPGGGRGGPPRGGDYGGMF